MLRAIFKNSIKLEGKIFESFHTIDLNIPEIEKLLVSGGVDRDNGTFEFNSFEGFEVRGE